LGRKNNARAARRCGAIERRCALGRSSPRAGIIVVIVGDSGGKKGAG